MPSFGNLLRRKDKPVGDKPVGSKPPQGFNPAVPDLTKTEQNADHLNQCAGCRNVHTLIQRNVVLAKNGSERAPPTTLHYSFDELDRCAYKCQICRVFRQALILAEITFDGVERLKGMPGPVMVRWEETGTAHDAVEICLRVEIPGQSRRAGVVNCGKDNELSHLALSPNVLEPVAISQAKQWLDTCLKTHVGDCDNLRWSAENPRLLIEIMSSTEGRLCENQNGAYVAVSYCWGMQALSQDGLDRVERGKTVKKNLERRRHSFSISDLPATVRDALLIIQAMGVRYAWVDSLCIVQDKIDPVQGKPEGIETMHLVYSNALFTLCACATTRATASLLDKREAWTQRTEPCRLGGRWLTTPDTSLSELRLESPLAGRAWTLQEERLSPRMLYVTSNRMHWSCAKSYRMEMKPTYERTAPRLERPSYASVNNKDLIPPAQDFLLACYSGQEDLHSYWADIVKSYSLRNMSVASDRLTALSGIAAKYLDANRDDQYLAGLWANHLAEGLAWRVERAIETSRLVREFTTVRSSWPSWSWAATPPPTAIETDASSAPSPSFARIADTAGPRIDMADSIKHGEQVKEIRVTGRTRPMWTPSSLRVDWSAVSRMVYDQEKFSFASMPEQDLHTIQTQFGRILVREERKKEVIGQIDYQQDVESLQSGKMAIKALEIGMSTMLLLTSSGEGKWRRVGVAWDVRRDYFISAQTETLALR